MACFYAVVNPPAVAGFGRFLRYNGRIMHVRADRAFHFERRGLRMTSGSETAKRPPSKPALNEWQREAVTQAYASSGNISYAAREAGCSYSGARNFINQYLPSLQALRQQRQGDVITQMSLVRRLALEELSNPARLATTETKDLAVVAGIMHDKIQLMEGQVTSRTGFVQESAAASPGSLLSPEERETARQLRDRMLSEGGGAFIDVKGKVTR